MRLVASYGPPCGAGVHEGRRTSRDPAEPAEPWTYEVPERISSKLNTGEVETLDNGIPFVDATLDLGDVPIVGVCGPMMMDALGRLHLTPQLTVESIIDVPDSHVSDVVAFGSHREHVAVVTKSGALMTCGSNNVPVGCRGRGILVGLCAVGQSRVRL